MNFRFQGPQCVWIQLSKVQPCDPDPTEHVFMMEEPKRSFQETFTQKHLIKEEIRLMLRSNSFIVTTSLVENEDLIAASSLINYSNYIAFKQWRIQNFHFGGAGNDQVKKSNNKIKILKALFKKFLESCECSHTLITILRSTPASEDLVQAQTKDKI